MQYILHPDHTGMTFVAVTLTISALHPDGQEPAPVNMQNQEKRTSDIHSNSPTKAFSNTGNPALHRKHLGKHETHSPAKEYKNRLKAHCPSSQSKEHMKAH
jgi:hypothetical protein